MVAAIPTSTQNCCRHTFIHSMLVAAIPTSTQCQLLPYLHLLKTVAAIPTSTQHRSHHTYIYSTPVAAIPTSTQKKGQEHFPIHEIGRIDGGRGFQTSGNMFQIGGNTFYHWKNEISMKILEFKRSGIGIIAEFVAILSGFPNQGRRQR